jgi:hypothetical protein
MGSIFEENNDIVSIPARLGGDEFAVTVAFDSSKYPIESIKKGLYEGIVVWGETETPHGVRMGDVAVSSIEKEISELFSEADPKKPKTWLQRFKKQIADQRHERRRQKAKQAA